MSVGPEFVREPQELRNSLNRGLAATADVIKLTVWLHKGTSAQFADWVNLPNEQDILPLGDQDVDTDDDDVDSQSGNTNLIHNTTVLMLQKST